MNTTLEDLVDYCIELMWDRPAIEGFEMFCRLADFAHLNDLWEYSPREIHNMYWGLNQ